MVMTPEEQRDFEDMERALDEANAEWKREKERADAAEAKLTEIEEKNKPKQPTASEIAWKELHDEILRVQKKSGPHAGGVINPWNQPWHTDYKKEAF